MEKERQKLKYRREKICKIMQIFRFSQLPNRRISGNDYYHDFIVWYCRTLVSVANSDSSPQKLCIKAKMGGDGVLKFLC